jgi:hypothetical protein
MQFIGAHEALESLLNDYQELNSMEITINSRALKNEEAIGHPDRDDFPLLRGKEVLLQAEIDGSYGQAFTSDPIAYQGAVKNILELPADRPGNYALMVAALNALVCKLGLADHTIHCKDNEPEDCAKKISQEVLDKHGICNIGIIGYQPAIIENCVDLFGADRIHITDLNTNNIGALRYGVKVLDGMTDTRQLIDFADVLLITGSILANGTYNSVLEEIADKPYYFFGTTCSGLAYFNKSNRLCPLSK